MDCGASRNRRDVLSPGAVAIVTPFLATFEEFPPRQKAASFTIDQALEKMQEAASGARD